MDQAGNLLGQNDAPPKDGAYPTSWWLPDEIIADRHTIYLSTAGVATVHLRTGMYDPTTMTRLPAYDSMGQHLPDDVIPLARINLEGITTCVSD